MAKIRSHVVSRASCAVVAKDLGLGERLRKEAKSMPEEEARPALPQPQRPRGGARGVVCRALPRARLRAGRGTARGRVSQPDRLRADEPGRLQDRPPGGARAQGPRGQLHGRRRGGPAARPALHRARRWSTARKRGSAGAARRRTPSRRPRSSRSPSSASRPRRPSASPAAVRSRPRRPIPSRRCT